MNQLTQLHIFVTIYNTLVSKTNIFRISHISSVFYAMYFMFETSLDLFISLHEHCPDEFLAAIHRIYVKKNKPKHCPVQQFVL